LRAIANLKGAQRNSYGPPIEGVLATVDMTNGRVVDVIDADETPFSRTSTDFYDPRVCGEPRAATSDLALAHATRSSVVIDGHDLAWQKWRMHWSMNPREGLVLRGVGYEDGGRVRSILYRASIAEMWVPYGDPSETWTWRNAFDEGEYGLGAMANTLVAGRDVPENALLFDAPIVGANGAVDDQPAVVAIYERDGGLLWSHKDDAAGTEARRATELVIRFVATAGNYDYGFQWIFRQDGTLAFEIDLTGILLTKRVEATQCQICRAAVPEGTSPRGTPGDDAHGTLVADHVVATNHQHFVSLRLDFDVDGPRNRVQELNVKSATADADNRGFVVERVPLRTEIEARRDLSLAEHRTWEVTSGDARNATGHATGYAIVPEGNAVPYLGRATRERVLAGFVEHTLWVTREHEGELFAAGDYPSQGGKPGGLAAWSSDDESIEDEDVVVWYTLGVTHVPRPEDYPVMPVEHAGVRFLPHGFFDRNPALDVP
jgi:primary-amine oxidase